MRSLFQAMQPKKKDLALNNFIKEIVSGGQTGVDRAALDVAVEYKIEHSGWCPHGRKAEDGVIPAKYHLREAPAPTCEEKVDLDAIYKKRTELNAKDSDGTLVIVEGSPIGGTLYTIEMTEKHKKPYFVLNLLINQNITDVAKWIVKNNIHKINIAGPRASQTVGIYKSAYGVLCQLINCDFLKEKSLIVANNKLSKSRL